MAKDFKLKGYWVKEITKDSRLYYRYVKKPDQKYYHVYGNKVNIVGTKDFILLMFKALQ